MSHRYNKTSVAANESRKTSIGPTCFPCSIFMQIKLKRLYVVCLVSQEFYSTFCLRNVQNQTKYISLCFVYLLKYSIFVSMFSGLVTFFSISRSQLSYGNVTAFIATTAVINIQNEITQTDEQTHFPFNISRDVTFGLFVLHTNFSLTSIHII